MKQLPLSERITQVVKIFSDSGYMTEVTQLPDGNYFIYQQHCAVHNLATQYRQICLLESRMLESLLGVRTARQSYMMKDDQVCGYMVYAGDPPEDLEQSAVGD